MFIFGVSLQRNILHGLGLLKSFWSILRWFSLKLNVELYMMKEKILFVLIYILSTIQFHVFTSLSVSMLLFMCIRIISSSSCFKRKDWRESSLWFCSVQHLRVLSSCCSSIEEDDVKDDLDRRENPFPPIVKAIVMFYKFPRHTKVVETKMISRQSISTERRYWSKMIFFRKDQFPIPVLFLQ